MINEGRAYRARGDKLILAASPEMVQTGEWEILDIIGEGSSAVCYSCVHGGKLGRLKEYSPINAAENNFDNFVNAYKILDEIKYSNSNFEILNNYIPHYEILYKYDADNKPESVFIWTPDDKKGTTFENYIIDVSAGLVVNPETTLVDIINVIATLTDCICLIHMAGLLHLDIKPSNFLVTYNSRKEINSGNISLFDINTLYSIESDFSNVVGTRGYCAPEISLGCPDNRSDIYSIGAMLFATIMKSGPSEYHNYEDCMYGNFESIIRTSGLINNSKINSKPEVIKLLCHIFERSLAADRNKRYDYCELLQRDLEDLLEILSRSNYEEKNVKRVTGEKKRRKRLYIEIAGVAAVLLALFGMYSFFTGDTKSDNITLDSESVVSISTSFEEVSPPEIEEPIADEKEILSCSVEEASERMISMINAASESFKIDDKYVLISPETVGNREVIFPNLVTITEGTTVEFSDEMIFDFLEDGYVLSVKGTLICDTDTIFSNTRGFYFNINFTESGKYIDKLMTVTFENLEGQFLWLAGTLELGYRNSTYCATWLTNCAMNVSASYEEFINAGNDYFWGSQEGSLKGVRFGGEDVFFDVCEPGNFEKLQTLIANLAWNETADGSEIHVYVDYPVIIGAHQELFIPDTITIHLVENGSITVEPGGNIIYSFTEDRIAKILEEGGKLIE